MQQNDLDHYCTNIRTAPVCQIQKTIVSKLSVVYTIMISFEMYSYIFVQFSVAHMEQFGWIRPILLG